MKNINKLKELKKARIGLYSAGLETYWGQFDGLYDCLIGYNHFVEHKLSQFGTVYNFGMIDTEQKARNAGEYFSEHNVDIVFSHVATYCTSACILPVHQTNKAPVIVLNLQPATEMDYSRTSTDRWLTQCVSCSIPEISNTFDRAGIKFRVVSGLLGLSETPEFSVSDEVTVNRQEAIRAWTEIEEWCQAATVKRNIEHSRFGYLGGYYSGMLDMYSDFTMLQAQTGMHIEILEMCDLEKCLRDVTEKEVREKLRQVMEFFEISSDSPSDPIARKPTDEQLQWACKVACAQEKMVRERDLDSLAYYYHGQDNNYYEQIQSGFIVGHSLLTAAGIPCAGEGDIKTALAMKICDIVDKGGSFCEIVASDFNRNTIILGHDGPFHLAISSGKPKLRGMGVYHGKRGNGVSVEAKVISGDVTTLGVTQTGDGKLKMNISEGIATDDPILMIGNTSTHVLFPLAPVEYMNKWFAEAPTHHCALSIGKNAGLFSKTAEFLDISRTVI